MPVAALAFGAGGASATSALTTSTTYYVSTSGSDTNPCSQASPCATIQHAVDLASPAGGDTVDVDAGHYNQAVHISKPLSLIGDGASKSIIDGSNIDTGASSHFGVVAVENNTGPGGAVLIKGFTIDNSYVTATEASQSDFPIDMAVYADKNPADAITVANVVLGPVQNVAAYGGIGFYTFNNVASATLTNSTSTGNLQGALLEGGGVGGNVTVSHDTFTKLVPCGGGVNGCSGSSAVFQPEGVFLLSDQPGTANATISNNTFHQYAGDGIDAAAGYSGGNCAGSNGPCTGSVNVTEANNSFNLGACTPSQGCDAIYLDAQSGNELTARISGNKGTVHSPDGTIFEQPDSGVYNVTETNNHIKVV